VADASDRPPASLVQASALPAEPIGAAAAAEGTQRKSSVMDVAMGAPEQTVHTVRDPEKTPEPIGIAVVAPAAHNESEGSECLSGSEVASVALRSPRSSSEPDSDDPPHSARSAASVESSHFRGNKRHAARRLLVTHTMGLQPSSALQLIIESCDDITVHYDLDKVLGQGAFGVVRKAKIKVTGAVRAIKAINKKKMKTQAHLIKQEIEIMKMLDHPNLLMLYEVLEDSSNLHLVIEMCTGGALSDYINKLGNLKEPPAAGVMQQILRGTLYLHKHSICHRDMKADNVLVDKAGPLELSTLKVADFGLSCMVEDGKVLTRPAGTPSHMAPEVFAKRYNKSCDIWSCGVIAFVCLSGYLPFVATNRDELARRISRGNVEFNQGVWADMSQDAIDFIKLLLNKNPKQRLPACRALGDKWIKKQIVEVRAKLPMKVIDDLAKFRSRSKLKRAALHVIASMLPEDDIREMRKAFIQLDRDGDGNFTLAELKECLENNVFDIPDHSRTNPKTYASRVAQEDTHGFSYTEFVAATFDLRKAASEGLCKAAFSSFDKNRDGSISISELTTGKMLGKMTQDEIFETFDELDKDGNCTLDFPEFMMMMRGQSMLSLPSEVGD